VLRLSSLCGLIEEMYHIIHLLVEMFCLELTNLWEWDMIPQVHIEIVQSYLEPSIHMSCVIMSNNLKVPYLALLL
jgi:hypothetical protein